MPSVSDLRCDSLVSKLKREGETRCDDHSSSIMESILLDEMRWMYRP